MTSFDPHSKPRKWTLMPPLGYRKLRNEGVKTDLERSLKQRQEEAKWKEMKGQESYFPHLLNHFLGRIH